METRQGRRNVYWKEEGGELKANVGKVKMKVEVNESKREDRNKNKMRENGNGKERVDESKR